MVWDFEREEGNSQGAGKTSSDKSMFAGLHRDNGTQSRLISRSCRVSPTTPSPYYIVVVYGESPFLATGPLSQHF